MEENSYFRQDVPPPRQRVVQIKKIEATTQFVCVIVSHTYQGYVTHWDQYERHSVPCEGGHDHCRWCKKGLPKNWNGYLHVIETRSHQDWFLELTEFAAATLQKFLVQFNTLRGLQVIVTRERQQKRAPIHVSLVGEAPPTWAKMGRALDPLITLRKIWRLPDPPTQEQPASV